MKRAYRFVCLIVAAGILGVAFFPQRPLSAEDGDPESPWMEIEKAARASTLSELAKLVYNQAFNFEGLSATTADEVIDRMVRHEELYRRKSTGGVPEINVVRAVNAMLDRFDAPAYAYTDVYEVRRLQLGMVGELPSLVAHELPGSEEADAKQSINPTLSPIEAVLVAGTLAHQKQHNGEFLFTFDEQLKRWSDPQYGNTLAVNDARVEEVRASVEKGALTMSPSDLLDLPNRFLDDLGIHP